MIHLFAGDDSKKKIKEYEAFLKTLPKNTEFFSLSKNNFNAGELEVFYAGTSLFSPVSAVILDGVLESEENQDIIFEKLENLEESPNHFIFLEGKLLKSIIDKFKKARAETNIFEAVKEKKDKFDNFLIANAFSQKDKLKTWIYFRQAIQKGSALEELSGILFWKAKDMLLRKNFGKFKEEDLKIIAGKISYLLPEARRESRDAEAAFEQFLLEAF